MLLREAFRRLCKGPTKAENHHETASSLAAFLESRVYFTHKALYDLAGLIPSCLADAILYFNIIYACF